MSETRVKIQSIVENQLPDFVAEENPLLVEFLKQYYISQEYPSGTTDLVSNLDKYIKLDEIFKNVNTCILAADISYNDTTITVSTSTDKNGNILTGTKGFPDKYGILKIDDEIIGDTPSDELARRLFSLEGVAGIHLNSNMITVKSDGSELSIEELIETISDLHIFYNDGIEVANDDEKVDLDT